MPGPRIRHEGPPTPWLLYWVGRLFFALSGWTLHGGPEGPKGIVLGVPHTSNWDGVLLVMASWVFRVKLSWIGKHTLFKPPFGWLLRLFGGISIDRRQPQGMVGQMVHTFESTDRLYVCVPPSGTRKYTEYWKSGFYFMALEAKVPIVLGFLDYGKKAAGLGPAFVPTGDVRADMDRIRAFYADVQGCHPESKSRIRLRVEDEPEGAPAPAPAPAPAGEQAEGG